MNYFSLFIQLYYEQRTEKTIQTMNDAFFLQRQFSQASSKEYEKKKMPEIKVAVIFLSLFEYRM